MCLLPQKHCNKGDDLFPTVALSYLPPFVAILIYYRADISIISQRGWLLCHSDFIFCIDILGLKRNTLLTENKQKK